MHSSLWIAGESEQGAHRALGGLVSAWPELVGHSVAFARHPAWTHSTTKSGETGWWGISTLGRIQASGQSCSSLQYPELIKFLVVWGHFWFRAAPTQDLVLGPQCCCQGARLTPPHRWWDEALCRVRPLCGQAGFFSVSSAENGIEAITG